VRSVRIKALRLRSAHLDQRRECPSKDDWPVQNRQRGSIVPGECQLSVYGGQGPCPTQPAATEAVSELITRGPLRAIDNKNLDRTLLRLQFQSELFL
jgi:hypothetical protein